MRRRGNVHYGRFGRGDTSRPRPYQADWLSPEAYNALSQEGKLALAARRKLRSSPNRFKPTRNRKKPRSRLLGWLKYQGVVVAAVLLVVAGVGWFGDTMRRAPVATVTGAAQVRSDFGLCHTGGGYNCVVDGDTIWLEGQNIRIADIDAPETHEPRCPSEQALGQRATQRLHQLVNSGTVTLEPIGDRDEDSYGRKLRLVLVNGASVGDTLVGDGLARYYGRGKQPWC